MVIKASTQTKHKVKPKSKAEIVLETIVFYGEMPEARRSVGRDGMSCRYVGQMDPEQRCAFSRCCTDESVKRLHEMELSGASFLSVLDLPGEVDDYLREEYRGHSSDFWHDVQSLHDNPSCWRPSGGLALIGIEYIKTRFLSCHD